MSVIVVMLVTEILAVTSPQLSDSTADWIVVNASLDGLEPSEDIVALAGRLGVELAPFGAGELGYDANRIHLRTPGAIVALSWMRLLPPGTAHVAMTIMSAIALWLIATHQVPRLSFGTMGNTPYSAALLLLTLPVWTTFEFGAQSLIVAALIGGHWLLGRRSDSIASGLLLGMATVLKLFPGLLFLAAIRARRRRSVIAGLGIVVFLNVTGMVVLGIRPFAVVEQLSQASRVWMGFSANASVFRLFGVVSDNAALVTLGGGLFFVGATAYAYHISMTSDELFVYLCFIAVMCSPLSWEHYDVAYLPAIAVAASFTKQTRFWAAGALALLVAGHFAARPFNSSVFRWSAQYIQATRLLVLVALLFVLHNARTRMDAKVAPWPRFPETSGPHN